MYIFFVVVVLFLLPKIELKCSFQTVSELPLATLFKHTGLAVLFRKMSVMVVNLNAEMIKSFLFFDKRFI